MKVIVTVDDHLGTMFNNRRQSMDEALRRYVLKLSEKSTLWMNAYSFKQFAKEEAPFVRVAEDFLESASEKDFCFVEGEHLLPYVSKIEELYLFFWNRSYPYDRTLDIPLKESGFKCVKKEEFEGNSHDCISLEVYRK